MDKAFEILTKRFGVQERVDKYGLTEYYKEYDEKTVYYTAAVLNDDESLIAYVAGETVHVYKFGDRGIAYWDIRPAHDEPKVGKLKFYDDCLVILYHDLRTWHLAKLYLPKDDLEFQVTVLKLAHTIHIEKDMIYYQAYGSQLVNSISLPDLKKGLPTTEEEAAKRGMVLKDYLFFELDEFEL